MSTEQPSIDELKASLDIITVAEMYGELKKSNSNTYIYTNDTSITFHAGKQIFKNHNGSMDKAGSVLDFIMIMEDKTLPQAVERMKELSHLDTYAPNPKVQLKRKEESALPRFSEQQIIRFEKTFLSAVAEYRPFLIEIDGSLSYYELKDPFIKLFETSKLYDDTYSRMVYVFKKLLGFNPLYSCPAILLHDSRGKIVDIANYRPNKPANYENWAEPKYKLMNSSHRGKYFLYPFQREMETIMKHKKVFAVGEGLKNALNAYVHGLAFVSLESTSTNASEALVSYVLDLLTKGYKVLSFFDGDDAGLKAFNKFKEATKLYDLENAVSFESGIDFAEYAVGASNE